MKKLSTFRGFTLIEILIAIAIIGVLAVASLAMINPLDQIKKGRDAQRKHDLRQMQAPLQAYFEDNGRFPAASGEQINGIAWGSAWQPYMAKLPKDPVSAQTYLYETDANGTYYRVYAKLEKCPDPQMIPEIDCGTAPYNYSVTSTNIAVALTLPTLTPIPTPTPTITPTPTPTPRAFKYVFVTRSTFTANLVAEANSLPGVTVSVGLDGGDKICKTIANSSTLPRVTGLTWKAWLSDSTTDAKDRIPDAEYRLVDGTTIVANNKADLIDETLDNAINRDADSSLVTTSNPGVFTGTKSDGTASFLHCNNWKDNTANFTVLVGNFATPDSNWTNWTPFWYCNTFARRLYCFEQ